MKEFSSYEELYSYFETCAICNTKKYVDVASTTTDCIFLQCSNDTLVFYNDTVLDSTIEVHIYNDNKIKTDINSINYIEKFNKQDLHFFLYSKCMKCLSYIDSSDIICSFDKNIIHSFKINKEMYIVTDNGITYSITNDYIINNSIIAVRDDFIRKNVIYYKLFDFDDIKKVLDKVKMLVLFN
tara:strand:+ start:14924 stop:15472 length:549 start_codon:yes stop_codon:yes gene_type:complete